MVRWPVQAASLAVILLIMAVQVRWMLCHRQQWRWSVPVFAWMIHSAVFYSFVLFGNVPMTNWSAILRLHGYLSVLTTEIARQKLSRGC